MPHPDRFRRALPLLSLLVVSFLILGLASGKDLLNGDSASLRLAAEFSAVLVIFLAALAPGWLIFKWLFKKVPGRQMEWLLTIAFGLCFLSYLGFVLCALHLLKWALLFILLMFLAASSLGIVIRSRSAWKLFPSGLDRADYLPLLILGCLLAISLIQSLSPPQKWDEQVYHLLLPKLFLAHGGFFKVPSNIYAWFPHYLEMIYTMLFTLADAVAPRLFHYLLGLLVLLVLGNFGAELFGSPRAGIWAMVLFGISGTYHLEATSAYLELGLTFWILLSVYSAYQYRETQETSWLLAAAILAGAALATKYLALGPVLVTAGLIFRWSARGRWRNSLGYLALAAGFLLPYLIRNLVWIGNPVYPFFAGFFPGGEWDANLLARYVYSERLEGMGRGWLDYLLLFPRLFLFAREETFWFDARFNPLLCFVSLAFFGFARCRRQIWLWLWFAPAFILWAVGPQHGRFFLPGVAVLALIAGGAFQEILNRGGKHFTVIVSGAALFLSLWFLPARVWQVSEEIKFIAGRLSLEDYLVRNRDRLGLRRINELLALNRLTPPGAKIFLLWENRGLYLRRDYLADSLFEVSYTKHLIAQLGSAENFHQWLKQNHFTYIYNGRTWKWDSDTYLQPETLAEFKQAETIYREFLDQHGQLVFRQQGELIWIK